MFYRFIGLFDFVLFCEYGFGIIIRRPIRRISNECWFSKTF